MTFTVTVADSGACEAAYAERNRELLEVADGEGTPGKRRSNEDCSLREPEVLRQESGCIGGGYGPGRRRDVLGSQC